MANRVLIIDDDTGLNLMLGFHFEDQGLEVINSFSCADGITQLARQDFDLILLDQQLPDGSGIDLLPRILKAQPEASIVMMTGQHDLELAIEAIKAGAADFVHKPVRAESLQETLEKVLAKRRLSKASDVELATASVGRVRDLIGRSDAMLKISKEIALSAETAATVLITGESGTGKEVVARLIHQHSNRTGPFVAVNCAAIVDTLLESELFGHEKGAFTGATARKIGRFEQANEGTLFLDEIGELGPHLQAKLLRALQEREFERVGGTELVKTTARVIAATHRDLFVEAERGHFREDLAYRLNVIRLRLPALRERPDDIPLLAAGLLKKAAQAVGKPAPPLAAEAIDKLLTYAWPGNVRELENVLTQALVQARDSVITADLIRFREATAERPTFAPESAHPPAVARSALRTLEEVEVEHVQRVLEHTGGHKGRSCDILGISRPALDRKIKKYNLRVPGG